MNQLKEELSEELMFAQDYCSYILKYLACISNHKWRTYFTPISQQIKKVLGIDLFLPISQISKKLK